MKDIECIIYEIINTINNRNITYAEMKKIMLIVFLCAPDCIGVIVPLVYCVC